MLVSLALLFLPAFLQRGEEPICQPKTYASPSGEVELFVDPSRPTGAGPARYRLTRRGKELWAGERPFTLWQAVVADDGRIGGYAYSQGLSSWQGGTFRVVALSSEGTTLLEDARQRVPSRSLHGLPDPQARGIFLDPASEGFVVRIEDPDPNRGSEEWWGYPFQTASEASTRAAVGGRSVERPEAFHDPEIRRWRRIQDARALQGSPLRLVWWWRHAYDEALGRAHVGATFSLVDGGCAEVWSMDLPDDYAVPDDADAQHALGRRVMELGALLDVQPEGRFSVWCVERRVRLDLRVRAADEPGRWVVETLGERAWDPPPRKAPEPAPAIELALLGSVVLEEQEDRGSLGPVTAFGFAPGGTLRLWRWKSVDEGELVTLDATGVAVGTARVDLSDLHDLQVRCWPLAQGRWLLTAGGWGGEGRCAVALVDEATGERVASAEWRDASFEAVSARPDGGFVALIGWAGSSGRQTLLAVDRGLRILWRVEQDYRDPAKLFSPEGVAVTPEGHVAVVDTIRKSIQIFDADGGYLETLDLASLLPAPPSYPCGLDTDPSGGLLLFDFEGPNPLVRLGERGEVRAALSVTPPKEISLGRLAQRARVAPDGALWTTDENALLRLDADGRVDAVVGRLPSPERLARRGATCIDHLGRVLIQDAKTGCLHAFDASGARLFVARPDPGDFERITGIETLSVEPDGTVHVPSDARRATVRFSTQGTRLGLGRSRGDLSSPLPDAFASEGSRWEERERGFDGSELRHVADRRTLAEVRRTVAGRWFDHSGVRAFAADRSGGLVVLHAGREPELDRGVSFYDADGTPRGMAPLAGNRLAVCDRWVAVSDFGCEAQLLRRSDGSVRSFVAPVEKGSACTFGFSPDGSELWVVASAGPTLYRFALP